MWKPIAGGLCFLIGVAVFFFDIEVSTIFKFFPFGLGAFLFKLWMSETAHAEQRAGLWAKYDDGRDPKKPHYHGL